MDSVKVILYLKVHIGETAPGRSLSFLKITDCYFTGYAVLSREVKSGISPADR